MAQDSQYFLKLVVVLVDSQLQNFYGSRELLIGGNELTQPNEGSHYLDARADGNLALEHIRQHYCAVFGEDVRSVFEVCTSVQGHNL